MPRLQDVPQQTRRPFLRMHAWGLAGLLWLCVLSNADAAVEARELAPPNIVLIMADDLGYECLGANGGASYATPVLDGLARDGARFTHCYSQPLCTPSRVQLMTGIYNVRNYVRFGRLERSQRTFAQLLKRRGYATCIAGKWQLGREPDAPQHFGFDQSCLWQHTRGRTHQGHDTRYPNPRLEINGRPVNYTNGEYGPDIATGFICDFMERHRDGPFLVYYPMILTHCPFSPTPDSEDWDPSSSGSKRYKGDPAYFGDMVAYMDTLVGRIVAKLEALGLRDNTLILFTGDNGTDQPIVSALNGRQVAGGKGRMTDAGTRVPLVASWPGRIPAGLVCDDLVDFSDFLPTLCEAARVPVPESLVLDGQSFLPQLEGRPGMPRAWIYCWYSRNGWATGSEWARNQRYKLYRSGKFFDIQTDVLENNPLDPAELNPDQQKTLGMLKDVLARYRNARPPSLH